MSLNKSLKGYIGFSCQDFGSNGAIKVDSCENLSEVSPLSGEASGSQLQDGQSRAYQQWW